MRSISRNGFSQVTAIFEENVNVYFARQQINERLAEAKEVLPTGVEPGADLHRSWGNLHVHRRVRTSSRGWSQSCQWISRMATGWFYSSRRAKAKKFYNFATHIRPSKIGSFALN